MRHLTLLGALCAALLGLGASSGTAQAAVAPSHGLLFELRELPPPANRALEGACGLAVDAAGKLYLSDYYSDRVLVINSSGTTTEGELKEVEPLDGPCGLAIDPAGDLFVNDYHRNVTMFTAPWGTGTVIDAGNSPETSPALRPTGVARDPSSGRIYVDDRTYIAAYEAPIEPGELPVAKIGLGNLEDGYGVAVSGFEGNTEFASTKGYLYVADAATETIKVFNPATSTTVPISEIDGEGAPGGGFNDLIDAALAVDSTKGHLFVLDNAQGQFAEHPEAGLYEFNSQGDFRGQVLPRELFDGEPSGLAVAPPGAPTAGNLYVTSGNSQGAKLFGLAPTGAARTLKVALALAGEGEGVVTSQPAGIRCGGACTAEFNAGASVTLTAAPDAGSAFAGWSVTGSAPCPGTGTCTVSLASGVEVVAEFEEAPLQPTVVSPGGGGEPAGTQLAPSAASTGPAPAPGEAGGGEVVASSAAPSGAHHRHRRHQHHHRHRRSRTK